MYMCKPPVVVAMRRVGSPHQPIVLPSKRYRSSAAVILDAMHSSSLLGSVPLAGGHGVPSVNV